MTELYPYEAAPEAPSLFPLRTQNIKTLSASAVVFAEFVHGATAQDDAQ